MSSAGPPTPRNTERRACPAVFDSHQPRGNRMRPTSMTWTRTAALPAPWAPGSHTVESDIQRVFLRRLLHPRALRPVGLFGRRMLDNGDDARLHELRGSHLLAGARDLGDLDVSADRGHLDATTVLRGD